MKDTFDCYKAMVGTEALAKELEEVTGTHAPDGPGELTADVTPHERGEPGGLSDLAKFLEGLEFTGGRFGGLQRVRTPEEHVIWVCPTHAKHYR